MKYAEAIFLGIFCIIFFVCAMFHFSDGIYDRATFEMLIALWFKYEFSEVKKEIDKKDD